MTKGETLEILKQIRTYYGGKFKVEDPQGTLERYHAVLIDYDFEEVQANLMAYVKTNTFAPGIADLISIAVEKVSPIPTVDETKALLQNWGKSERAAADAAVIEEEKAKIRRMLGIERGEQ